MMLELIAKVKSAGLAVLVVAIVLAGMAVVYERRLAICGREKSELADLVIQKQTALAAVTENRDQLQGVVDEQNRAIEGLQGRARELEDAATLRAMRAMQEGRARRRAVLEGHGSGPEGMNAWVGEAFSP